MKPKLLLTVSMSLLQANALYAGSSVSQVDLDLLTKLEKGNISEVQTAEFVKSKSSTKSVKEFASRMADDHSTMKKSLSDWAEKNSITLPQVPNDSKDEGKKLENDLSKLSGRKFDEHYIKAMLEDHQKDVAEVQEFIQSHPESILLPVLKKTLPILENHLRVAENVAGGLKIPPDDGLNHPEHP